MCSLLMVASAARGAALPGQVLWALDSGDVVIDDGDAGFLSEVGSFQHQSTVDAFNSDHLLSGCIKNGNLKASWSFRVAPGKYKVSVTHNAISNGAKNVPFTIYDGIKPINTVLVDQRIEPAGNVYQGRPWQEVGTYAVTSSMLKVIVGCPRPVPTGGVSVDAVRVQKVEGQLSVPSAVTTQQTIVRSSAPSVESTQPVYVQNSPQVQNVQNISVNAETCERCQQRIPPCPGNQSCYEPDNPTTRLICFTPGYDVSQKPWTECTAGEVIVEHICPSPPDCTAPPEGCSYENPVYSGNNCLLNCGTLTCPDDDIPPPPPPPPPIDDESHCGDGVINAVLEEQCDDGNRKPGDGCNPFCRSERCGDEIVTVALDEECDDGNTVNYDGCNFECKFEYCGDNVIQSVDERCDDGNVLNGDGCDSFCQEEEEINCRPITCIDGREFPNCDANGNPINYYVDPCSTPLASICGNGVIQAGENCEDGNADDEDGCSSNCVTEEGWECEVICPSIAQNSEKSVAQFFKSVFASIVSLFSAQEDPSMGNCVSVCETVCGDELIKGDEECDDGNLNDEDGCNNDCEVNHSSALECGNEILEPDNDEECDDGNANSDTVADACRTDCTEHRCGDNVVDSDEECLLGDDADCGTGNVCNESCMCEQGHPSGPVCGDGVIESPEKCDDNNIIPGDGCNSSCAIETNWTCTGQPSVCTNQPPVQGNCSKCEDVICSDGKACFVKNDNSGTICGPIASTIDGHTRCIIDSVCGNGWREHDEYCDNGEANSDTQPNACRTNCVRAHCGDGVKDNGEVCDGSDSVCGAGKYCANSCKCEETASAPVKVTVSKVNVTELNRAKYTVTVHNKSTSTNITGYSLVLPWPAGLTFHSASPTCDRDSTNTKVICPVGQGVKGLGYGQSISYWFEFGPSGNTCPIVHFIVKAEARTDQGRFQSNEYADNILCTQALPRCGDRKVNQLWEQCDDGNNTQGDGCHQCLHEPDPINITPNAFTMEWGESASIPFGADKNSSYSTAVAHGKIYVLGGLLNSKTISEDVYTTVDGKNWEHSVMKTPVLGQKSVAHNNGVWVVGGRLRSGNWGSVVQYTTDGNKWNFGPELPDTVQPLYSAVSFKGKLWLIGAAKLTQESKVGPYGTYWDWSMDTNVYARKVYVLDSPSSAWREVGDVLPAKAGQAVVYANKIWMLKDNNLFTSTDGEQWQPFSVLPQNIKGFELFVHQNKLWIYGQTQGAQCYKRFLSTTDGINWQANGNTQDCQTPLNGHRTLSHANRIWIIDSSPFSSGRVFASPPLGGSGTDYSDVRDAEGYLSYFSDDRVELSKSSDGRYIAYVYRSPTDNEKYLRRIDTQTYERKDIPGILQGLRKRGYNQPVCSANCSEILVWEQETYGGADGSIPGKLYIINVLNPNQITQVWNQSPPGSTATQHSMSRDGKSVVFLTNKDVDNDPATTYNNQDGSMEVFIWRKNVGKLTQLTNIDIEPQMVIELPRFIGEDGRFVTWVSRSAFGHSERVWKLRDTQTGNEYSNLSNISAVKAKVNQIRGGGGGGDDDDDTNICLPCENVTCTSGKVCFSNGQQSACLPSDTYPIYGWTICRTNNLLLPSSGPNPDLKIPLPTGSSPIITPVTMPGAGTANPFEYFKGMILKLF